MRAVIISTFCAGLLLVAYSVSAQTPSGPATRRPDPIQGELQRRFEAEAVEKLLARRPQDTTAYDRRELLDQIRKDFLRIQVLNDELSRAPSRADEPDLRFIGRHVNEVRRCGERLKENLSLPKVDSAPESSPVTGVAREQLRLDLSILSKSINSFVENRIFESSKVVDADLSAQASRDLAQIIGAAKAIEQLTEQLRRHRPSPS